MAFDLKAARVVADRKCYRVGSVREWLSVAIDEIERLRSANAEAVEACRLAASALAAMRDFLPDPESCSGWDDAGAQEEVALDLANLARFKGVEESAWPAHIKAADRAVAAADNYS